MDKDEDKKEDIEDTDDVVIEEESEEDSFGNDPVSKIKKLKEQIKKLEQEKSEYLTGWQRAKADYANKVRQDEEQRKELIKFSNERLIDDMIPVLQSFDMAMLNKEAWEKVEKNWRIGVEYIYNQLKQTLEQNGLEEVNPEGLTFDPMRDEAIEYTDVKEEELSNKIIAVIQKGYKLNDRIIRPPRVKVGEWKEEA